MPELTAEPKSASGKSRAVPTRLPIRRAVRFSVIPPIIAILSGMAVCQSKAPATAGSSEYQRGLSAMQKGDLSLARAAFEKAVKSNPKSANAQNMLGQVLLQQGDVEAAIPHFRIFVKLRPPGLHLFQIGNCLAKSAGKVIGKSQLTLTPHTFSASATQTKDYPNARKAFAKMFEVPPDSAASYLFTARMLFRHEFDPIAEEYGQKAVTLDPKLALAHFLLGELYLYKSRVPEAIVEFQKELVINPGHAATYYKLADAYSRMQKFEDAERLLQRSIWLDDTSTGPYILMGKVLEKKGEFHLAVRALQKAATMDPNNAMTHHLLGQAYRDMGKKEEAETELKLAEQLQTQQDSRP
jgi:tetratricopeptide (TPR) repeat protein